MANLKVLNLMTALNLMIVSLVWQLAMSPAAVATEECIRYYHELEDSLVGNPLNLDSLTQGFFPSNEPSVPVVEVFYTISNSSEPAEHPLVLELQGLDETELSDLAEYRYRWSESPIFLFMDPDILEKLALFTIRMRYHAVRLVIQPICENNTVNNTPLPEYLLNQLTAHLKTYASRRRNINGEGVQEDDQGYSSYYNKSDYDVINFGTSYQKSMILLVIGLIALGTFITIATPLLLNEKYSTLYKLAYRDNTNHLFVIWATVIVLSIASVVIVGVDIYFLFFEPLTSSQYAVWPYYLAVACSMVFTILDLLLVNFVRKQRYFPLPYCLEMIFCCTRACCKGSTVVLQILAMWVVTIFMQLVAFHLTFVFLAFVASPVQTGSTFLLFATGVLSTISVVTLLLASIQNNFSPDMTEVQRKRKFHTLCFKSLHLIPFASLLVFTVFFATCYVRVTISMGDVQSGGIPTLIASLAPAALLGVMGYLGRHVLVRYVPRRSLAMIPPHYLPSSLKKVAEGNNSREGSEEEMMTAEQQKPEDKV